MTEISAFLFQDVISPIRRVFDYTDTARLTMIIYFFLFPLDFDRSELVLLRFVIFFVPPVENFSTRRRIFKCDAFSENLLNFVKRCRFFFFSIFVVIYLKTIKKNRENIR